ncbi:PH domain-containing protein [Mariniluteicoccus endophyticus]
MSEPSENTPTTGGPIQKGFERPHPLTPLIRGWVFLVAAVAAVGNELVKNRDGLSQVPWWVPLAVMASVAVLSVLVSIIPWWMTRFVIDDDELRIETGLLNRSSKRIAFRRVQSIDVIQPLAARIFGLCELRIEAGGGESGLTLRYLSRPKAYAIRDYLLSRAHGDHVTRAEAAAAPQANAFEDLAAHDQILVRLTPAQLVLGLVTSTEFIVSLLVTAVFTAGAIAAGQLVVVAGGLMPMVIGVLSMVSRRVIAQFNYTLARTGRGLRITRGLTNLTSQSVPIDRVQGIRIHQSWLWRRLGYHRVDIDVLGYGTNDDTNNKGAASSMLLPVASADQVRLALFQLLPGVDTEAVFLLQAPSRARWVAPLGQPALRHGFDDRILISDSGRLNPTRQIVPHAKVQSVRLRQGPLQRRLDLCTVHVDTTPGPVHLAIENIAPGIARALVEGELARAAYARSAEAHLGLQTPRRGPSGQGLDTLGQ